MDLGPGLNLITGENAQGKTNLLEAVATVSLTRSPRAGAPEEIVRWGASAAAVEARVRLPTGSTILGIRFTRDREGSPWVRSTTVDAKPRPARSVLGICPVVLFSPDDLRLVAGGPDGRRRQLDMLLAQLDPKAAVDLIQYRRALGQRNALLRQQRVRADRGAPLQQFTAAVLEHGARVRRARAMLCEALGPVAAQAAGEVSGGHDRLGLRYLADNRPLAAGTSVEDARAALAAALARLADEERVRGLTLAGPHRDDVEFLLNDRPARSTASQGQQRSIVLAFKLAEVARVRQTAGVGPVLLLDDVLGELDSARREYLLTALARAGPLQLLVTATDAAPFPERIAQGARVFSVHRGAISDGKIP